MADAILSQLPIVTLAAARDAGLQHYFTGKPCKHGHVDFRLVASRVCATCSVLKSAQWREQFPDRATEQSRLYRETHKEERAATSKAWALANPERKKANDDRWAANNKDRHIALRKRWLEENPDRRRVWIAEWRVKNKDSQAANNVAWRAANRDRSNAIARNRRARVRDAEGTHTEADVQYLLAAQKWKCAGCKDKVKPRLFHVDHITPIAKGGRNDRVNLQILCPMCNLKKSSKDPIDWAQENGRLL